MKRNEIIGGVVEHINAASLHTQATLLVLVRLSSTPTPLPMAIAMLCEARVEAEYIRGCACAAETLYEALSAGGMSAFLRERIDHAFLDAALAREMIDRTHDLLCPRQTQARQIPQ